MIQVLACAAPPLIARAATAPTANLTKPFI